MLEDARADLRVAADLLPLVAVQRARLEQDRVGDPELADVVQHAGGADALDPLGAPARGARPVCSASRPTVSEWRAVPRSRRSSVSASSIAAASCSPSRPSPAQACRAGRASAGGRGRRGRGRGAGRRRGRRAPRAGSRRPCRRSCPSRRARSRPRSARTRRRTRRARPAAGARRRPGPRRGRCRAARRRTRRRRAASARRSRASSRCSTAAKRRRTSSPASGPRMSFTWRKSSRSQTSTRDRLARGDVLGDPRLEVALVAQAGHGSCSARWRRCSSWRADSTALIAWLANARSACRPSVVGQQAVVGLVDPDHAGERAVAVVQRDEQPVVAPRQRPAAVALPAVQAVELGRREQLGLLAGEQHAALALVLGAQQARDRRQRHVGQRGELVAAPADARRGCAGGGRGPSVSETMTRWKPSASRMPPQTANSISSTERRPVSRAETRSRCWTAARWRSAPAVAWACSTASAAWPQTALRTSSWASDGRWPPIGSSTETTPRSRPVADRMGTSSASSGCQSSPGVVLGGHEAPGRGRHVGDGALRVPLELARRG